MGIGKQAFDAFVKTFQFAWDRIKGQSVVIEGDWYINRKIGLAFEKPPGWGFVHTKDFGELREGQFIGHAVEDSEEEIWEHLGEPACLVTKYAQDDPALKGIFSPTIMLHISPRKVYDEEESVNSFEEFLDMTASGMAALLKGFRVVRQLPPYEMAGHQVYERDADYLFEHAEIDAPLPVELKTLHFLSDRYLFSINLHQSATQNQLALEEFDRFLASLKIV